MKEKQMMAAAKLKAQQKKDAQAGGGGGGGGSGPGDRGGSRRSEPIVPVFTVTPPVSVSAATLTSQWLRINRLKAGVVRSSEPSGWNAAAEPL